MGSSDGGKVRGSSDPLSSLFFVRFVLPERHQTGRQRPDRTGPRSLSGSQHGKLQKVLALPAFLVQNAVSQRGVTHCDASLARAEIGRRNGVSGSLFRRRPAIKLVYRWPTTHTLTNGA